MHELGGLVVIGSERLNRVGLTISYVDVVDAKVTEAKLSFVSTKMICADFQGERISMLMERRC